jgi:plasmid maintenance system antidote protein VapI
MPRSKTLSGQLREYIRRGMKQYGSLFAFARACGIPAPMLHRFVNDGLDLRLATADKLVAFFGCELTEPVWGRSREDGE